MIFEDRADTLENQPNVFLSGQPHKLLRFSGFGKGGVLSTSRIILRPYENIYVKYLAHSRCSKNHANDPYS